MTVCECVCCFVIIFFFLHNLKMLEIGFFFSFSELTAIIFLKKALSVQHQKRYIPCRETRRSTTTLTFHAVQADGAPWHYMYILTELINCWIIVECWVTFILVRYAWYFWAWRYIFVVFFFWKLVIKKKTCLKFVLEPSAVTRIYMLINV